jgi:hypothetical protein
MKNQRIRIDTNQTTTFNDFEAKKTDYTQLGQNEVFKSQVKHVHD